jgi:predicted nuclease of predicted toxin-antitoxin system
LSCSLTHDLDFGAILASSGANIPSVIQIRTEDLRTPQGGIEKNPEVLAGRVVSMLAQLAQALADGALVTIEPARERVRILPLQPERSS